MIWYDRWLNLEENIKERREEKSKKTNRKQNSKKAKKQKWIWTIIGNDSCFYSVVFMHAKCETFSELNSKQNSHETEPMWMYLKVWNLAPSHQYTIHNTHTYISSRLSFVQLDVTTICLSFWIAFLVKNQNRDLEMHNITGSFFFFSVD